ncbi:hypothetical protein CQA91_21440 [Shigella flexneri]|nr:hypothetical protein CG423_15040 [Shigella flexneri]OXW62256.1 hypothetical protein CG418_15595 [Shigella flexneri]OXW70897.1 hypothetical protein CG425_16555 [Shigella flexneri]OXW75438.1 hypothetical protein CG415_15445 [Shigella flexneri]OXW87239.1 hypothetical protein CG416_06155 [Shigella flexneri]
MWTKANVRRVIPINVGMTSPKRRRINCNITRILYSDSQPGTACLYCSQINSRPCRTENEVLLPDGAARRGTAPPGIQIVDKVRFVYAGCGVNALSGLQNRANSIHCRIFVGLISGAHQAVLPLPSVLYGF